MSIDKYRNSHGVIGPAFKEAAAMLKVSCPQAELHSRVQTVGHGVTGRSTQPVQNNLYLETSGGKLRLVATDLEFLSVEALIDADVQEEGSITVPARLITEVMGAAAGSEIMLEADERNTLMVTSANSRWEIRGMSAGDYEMLPDLADAIELELPQSALHSVLSQTVFATSQDETRPILTGALFNITGGGMEVVATDTYRLALRTMTAEIPIEEPRSAIISARALKEVLGALQPDSDEPVTIAFTDSQVNFIIGALMIGSRLIEGQFPNYEKVLPDATDRQITMNAQEFADALRRTLIVAREDAYRVVITGEDGAITIKADSQDVGHADEQVPARLEGEKPEIAFNARYLLEALDAITEEEIVIELSQPLSPGTMKPVGSDDYLYVIMPMQIM
jgi:DNA polymerase-3 subunit beta